MIKLIMSVTMFFPIITAGNLNAAQLITPQQEQKIKKVIGEDWILTVSGDNITISSKKIVYIYTCINLPVIKDKKYFYENYVKNERNKNYYTYTFLFVPLWSEQKLAAVKKNNDQLEKLISTLPEKYNIAHLHRNKLGSYYATTKEEEKRVKQFEKERDKIRGNIKVLPDFHTKRYSVYKRESATGWECVDFGENKLFPIKKVITILKNG